MEVREEGEQDEDMKTGRWEGWRKRGMGEGRKRRHERQEKEGGRERIGEMRNGGSEGWRNRGMG